MFESSSNKKISCISEIWYHSPISCSTANYENLILSHSRRFKNDHRILYVVYVRLLAKLWDNEFSWNHDRTYLLQVMVGIFFLWFRTTIRGLVQHGISVRNVSQTQIMRSLVCPYIAYFISAQSFWNVVHCTAVILTWSVQNIKNMCKLKGMLLANRILRNLRLRLISDGYPPTLDSPVGARFFVQRHSFGGNFATYEAEEVFPLKILA